MRIGVLGLGYVGLPLAVAMARACPGTIGFDSNPDKVRALLEGVDRTGEVPAEELQATTLTITADPGQMAACGFFIVAVPTPIDAWHRPDLRPVLAATETVGRVLKPGAIVVYESTVYPGLTEEVCGPLLERISGLRQGRDFHLGYSPERINPGDREHTLARITKVVSGDDAATLDQVAEVYAKVVPAGIHRAPSIRVAEAAKVIENTQRDINIALMNELAIIFDRMGIRTSDVLAASRTKWNFLPFTPGLVGGHCIGVDPYYLTTKAEELGYHPEVILAGRRINDGMGGFVAQKTVKLLTGAGFQVKGARVGILGLAFKEDVPDLRNSRVPDIARELLQFGIEPLIHDPHGDPREAMAEYRITLQPLEAFQALDALIVAVGHRLYLDLLSDGAFLGRLKPGGVLVDIKSIVPPAWVSPGLTYWSL